MTSNANEMSWSHRRRCAQVTEARRKHKDEGGSWQVGTSMSVIVGSQRVWRLSPPARQQPTSHACSSPQDEAAESDDDEAEFDGARVTSFSRERESRETADVPSPACVHAPSGTAPSAWEKLMQPPPSTVTSSDSSRDPSP